MKKQLADLLDDFTWKQRLRLVFFKYFQGIQVATDEIPWVFTVTVLVINFWIQVVIANNTSRYSIDQILLGDAFAIIVSLVFLVLTLCWLIAVSSLVLSEYKTAQFQLIKREETDSQNDWIYRPSAYLYQCLYFVIVPVSVGLFLSQMVFGNLPQVLSHSVSTAVTWIMLVCGLLGILQSLTYLMFIETYLPRPSFLSSSNRLHTGIVSFNLCLSIILSSGETWTVKHLGNRNIGVTLYFLGRLILPILAVIFNWTLVVFFHEKAQSIFNSLHAANIVLNISDYYCQIKGNKTSDRNVTWYIAVFLIPLLIKFFWRSDRFEIPYKDKNVGSKERSLLLMLRYLSTFKVLSKKWSDKDLSIYGFLIRQQDLKAYFAELLKDSGQEFSTRYHFTIVLTSYVRRLFEVAEEDKSFDSFELLAYHLYFLNKLKFDLYLLSLLLARIKSIKMTTSQAYTFYCLECLTQQRIKQTFLNRLPETEQDTFYAEKQSKEQKGKPSAKTSSLDASSLDMEVFVRAVTTYESLVKRMSVTVDLIDRFYDTIAQPRPRIAQMHQEVEIINAGRSKCEEKFLELDFQLGESKEHLFYLIPFAKFLYDCFSDTIKAYRLIKRYRNRKSLKDIHESKIKYGMKLDQTVAMKIDGNPGTFGLVKYCTESCYPILGTDTKDIVGGNLSEMLGESIRDFHEKIMDDVLKISASREYLGQQKERFVCMPNSWPRYQRIQAKVEQLPSLQEGICFMAIMSKLPLHELRDLYIVLSSEGKITGIGEGILQNSAIREFCKLANHHCSELAKDFDSVLKAYLEEIAKEEDEALSKFKEYMGQVGMLHLDPQARDLSPMKKSFRFNSMHSMMPQPSLAKGDLTRDLQRTNAEILLNPAVLGAHAPKMQMSIVFESVSIRQGLKLAREIYAFIDFTLMTTFSTTQRYSQANRLQALNTLGAEMSQSFGKGFTVHTENVCEQNTAVQIHFEKALTSSLSSVKIKQITKGVIKTQEYAKKKVGMLAKKAGTSRQEGTLKKHSLQHPDSFKGGDIDIDGSVSASSISSEFRRSTLNAVSTLRFRNITIREFVAMIAIFLAFWAICIYNTSSLNTQFNVSLHNMIMVRKNLKEMFWMSTETKDLGNINMQLMLYNRGLIPSNKAKFAFITKGNIPQLQDEFNTDLQLLQSSIYRYRAYMFNLPYDYSKEFTGIQTSYASVVNDKSTKRINSTFSTWGAAFQIAYITQYWNSRVKSISFDSSVISDYSSMTGSIWTAVATASATLMLTTDNDTYTALTQKFTIYILVGTGISIALAGFYVVAQLLVRKKIIWIYKYFGKLEMSDIAFKKEQLAILKSGIAETLDLQDTGFSHFASRSGFYAKKPLTKDSRSRRPFATNMTCFGMLTFILIVFSLMQAINVATYVTLVDLGSRGSAKLIGMNMVRYFQRMGALHNNISGRLYLLVIEKLGLKTKSVNVANDLTYVQNSITEMAGYLPTLQSFIDSNIKKQGYDRLASDFLVQKPADIVDYKAMGMTRAEVEVLCDGTFNRTLIEFNRWQYYTVQNLYTELASYNSSTVLSILTEKTFLQWDFTRRFFAVTMVVEYMYYAFDTMDNSLSTDDSKIVLNLLAIEIVAFILMLVTIICETISSYRHTSTCLSSLSLLPVHTYIRNMQLRTLVLKLEKM